MLIIKRKGPGSMSPDGQRSATEAMGRHSSLFPLPRDEESVGRGASGDEGGGGRRLVFPGGWQDAFGFVVTRQTMNSRLGQNQTELGITILSNDDGRRVASPRPRDQPKGAVKSESMPTRRMRGHEQKGRSK